MKKFILCIIVISAIFQASIGSNVITLPYSTTDISYSKIRGKLYALVDAIDPEYGNRLIEINVTTGIVERSVFVGSQPYLMKLTSDENFAWISFEGIPFIKRVDLKTFEIDKEMFLGPSKQEYEPNHRLSTIFAYNFTVFPNENNKLALGLKTPYIFDFEELSLYKNDSIQPIKIKDSDLINDYYPFCFEPVLNGEYLIGHYQSSSESVFSKIKVLDNGLEFMKEEITEYHDPLRRNWIKVHNDTIYTAIGEILKVSDSLDLNMLGTCYNDVLGDRYGFIFSDIHNSFVYTNIHNDSVFLTYYDKNTFAAFDSAYLFDYHSYRYILILEMEIIDRNRLAILIGKDYEDSYIKIIEMKETGIESIQTNYMPEIFPNPASNRFFIKGYPINKKIWVYDISGNLIETFKHTGMIAEIDLRNYNSGLYLIKVSDIDNKYNSIFKKIVLQK